MISTREVFARRRYVAELMTPGRTPRFSGLYTLDRDHPLARGLVGWYLLNDGAGVTARDLSGFGNDGALTNFARPEDIIWGTDEAGPLLQFRSYTYNHVEFGRQLPFTGPAFSFSAWITPAEWSGSSGNGVFTRSTSSGGSTDIGTVCGHVYTGQTFFRYNGGDSQISLENALTLHVRQRLMFVHRADGTGEAFVNGVSVDTWSGQSTSPDTTGNDALGYWYDSTVRGRLYDGGMADARIWNRSLSAAEVLMDYRGAMMLRPVVPFFAVPAAGGGEAGALTAGTDGAASFGAIAGAASALTAGATAGATSAAMAAAVASVLADAQAGHASTVATANAGQFLADAQAGHASTAVAASAGQFLADAHSGAICTAIASSIAEFAAGVQAGSTGAGTAATNAQIAAGATAGDTPGSAAGAIGALAAGADAAATLAALSQAAGAFAAGAAAGETWTAETEAAQVASLAAGTVAGVAYLAAAQSYGAIVGASSAAASIDATASALCDFAASATASASFAALAGSSAALIAPADTGATFAGSADKGERSAFSAGALAELVTAALAATTAALQVDAIAGATFVGLTSEDGRTALRGAITLRVALRALPDTRPH